MGGETLDVIILSDPDLAADLADRLVGELPELLSQRISDEVTWRVGEVLNPLAGDEQVNVDLMVEVVGKRMPELGWDYGVCLTDLPRRAGRRPVVAELSADNGIALVSLPAFGSVRLYPRVREAVVHLIGELHGSAYPARAHPLGRSEPGDGSGLLFVVPGARGRLRLLAGMVRANRPWRLFLGLSKTLAGVFAVAAFALLQSDVWRIATTLGPLRQTIVAVTAVAALVTWLVVDHELWERPSGAGRRARAVLYNTATSITVTLGVLCLYAALLLPLTAVLLLVLSPPVLANALGHAPGWADYAAISWFATSASMVGGALGAGLEDDAAVRRAAYGERQRQRQRLLREDSAEAA
jgi:hypothetical protein